jgi:hypothetical protein
VSASAIKATRVNPHRRMAPILLFIGSMFFSDSVMTGSLCEV